MVVDRYQVGELDMITPSQWTQQDSSYRIRIRVCDGAQDTKVSQNMVLGMEMDVSISSGSDLRTRKR